MKVADASSFDREYVMAAFLHQMVREMLVAFCEQSSETYAAGTRRG